MVESLIKPLNRPDVKSGRGILWLVLGWLLLAAGGAVFFGRQRDASWNGYSLSELLATYTRIYQGQLTTPGWQDTRIGVRHIGTNGLPYLVRWIGYERPAWKDHLLAFSDHASVYSAYSQGYQPIQRAVPITNPNLGRFGDAGKNQSGD